MGGVMTTQSETASPDPAVLFASEEEEGVRLDAFLARRYPDHSRTYFQGLIQGGFVTVNGDPVKKRTALEEGDEIEVLFQLTPESPLIPEPIDLQILYEDEDLIAIDKPAGMVVHPGAGHGTGTVVNGLLAHCRLSNEGHHLRPGIVHRLDRFTSGILIAAKTVRAHQQMVALFAQRQIEKQYLAICVGKPRPGILSAPIGRHPVSRKEMTVLADGKEAITEILPLAVGEKISLALVKPKTGRTHQIRVHLKHLGTPVLGDEVYGSTKANNVHAAPRQLLHAYRLRFSHPISGETIDLIAPIPSDMLPYIQQLQPASCNIS